MIATVTGRIGGLMIGNNLLGYIKGGWAWKDTEYNLGTGSHLQAPLFPRCHE